MDAIARSYVLSIRNQLEQTVSEYGPLVSFPVAYVGQVCLHEHYGTFCMSCGSIGYQRLNPAIEALSCFLLYVLRRLDSGVKLDQFMRELNRLKVSFTLHNTDCYLIHPGARCSILDASLRRVLRDGKPPTEEKLDNVALHTSPRTIQKHNTIEELNSELEKLLITLDDLSNYLSKLYGMELTSKFISRKPFIIVKGETNYQKAIHDEALRIVKDLLQTTRKIE